jgi:molybdopterin/thiamine biosynthesis adenylyltransferase
MTELVISVQALEKLINALHADVERGAVLFLNHDPVSDRYLVANVLVAEEGDVLHAHETEITFAPQFLTKTTRRARENRKALALLHTHPRGYNNFSTVDDRAEEGLAPFMLDRLGGQDCLSVVLCGRELVARKIGSTVRMQVRVVGSDVRVMGSAQVAINQELRYDRQVRAFGQDGQRILANTKVAIVGLGGTGSIAAQQLAHLGVRNFVLIDPDRLEETNLNRVVGSDRSAVGREKVSLAADTIRKINCEASVDVLARSVISNAALERLRRADCIFMCTDSHASRAFLSEISYQYLIPAFDIGVSINASGEQIDAITGRTQMVGPGMPCLLCSNALSSQRIREELMTDEQRAADPYFNAGGVTQPAVISINGVMVSLAVTMFLSAFTAVPASGRWQSYDALTGRVRLLSAKSLHDCAICGHAGVEGVGASQSPNFL